MSHAIRLIRLIRFCAATVISRWMAKIGRLDCRIELFDPFEPFELFEFDPSWQKQEEKLVICLNTCWMHRKDWKNL